LSTSWTASTRAATSRWEEWEGVGSRCTDEGRPATEPVGCFCNASVLPPKFCQTPNPRC
jgi:hypothetical protein